MFRKILVPFDESESARHALENAIDMTADIEDAQITVLRVVDWHDFNEKSFDAVKQLSKENDISPDQVDRKEANNLIERDMVEDLCIGTADITLGRQIDIKIAIGTPADEIIDESVKLGCDCIVMGHRGLGVIRGMLGSVAYAVLQKSEAPVLICK